MEILSLHGFELKEEGVWGVAGKVRVLKLGMLCLEVFVHFAWSGKAVSCFLKVRIKLFATWLDVSKPMVF